jgi:predicted nicotinamide N-methyase
LSRQKPETALNFHGASMPTANHREIRNLRRQGVEPAIHGNKLWKSSFLLVDYLNANRPEYSSSVIDVGCGWGFGGVWCAKTLGSEVTSVDADPDVFPYLNSVARINGVETLALKSRFERLSKRQLAEFDMLIAADICFWDDLVNPVSKMIDRAVDAGVKHIVIADPERSSFFTMAQRCMQKHCADLIEWEVSSPVNARGALLVIENA